jgi:predicted DNA-binding transcriptional regulator YafY
MAVQRYAPAERLVRLMLMLAESRGGLTVQEMASSLEVSRRTIERLRDKLDQITGAGLRVVDDDGQKRWSLPTRYTAPISLPTVEELGDLRVVATEAKLTSSPAARSLEALVLKVEAMVPRSTMRRYAPDAHALAEAAGSVWRPGPRVLLPEVTLQHIRDCLLMGRWARLTYQAKGEAHPSLRKVAPLGVLSGSRGYLVARREDGQYRTYALDAIFDFSVTEDTFERDPQFDLREFASRSFGVFWDGRLYDVVWKFTPAAAKSALSHSFHPAQTVEETSDGSVLVRFAASGLTEMAWHLFRWGGEVEVLSPPELQVELKRLVKEAAARLHE